MKRPSPAQTQAFLLYIIATCVVGVLCVPWAITRALWTDDLYSLTTAEEPVRQIIRLCSTGIPGLYDHPPFFFILLHQVLIYGNSPLMTRLLSLVFTALAAGLLGSEMLRHYNFGVACAAVALLLSHPAIRFQAINVRMYGLYLFLSVASGVIAFRAIRRTEYRPVLWESLLLGFTLAVALYTTYFGTLLSLFLLLPLMIVMVKPDWFDLQRRRPAVILIGGVVVGLALFLPWFPVMVHMLKTAASSNETHLNTVSKIVRLLSHLEGAPVGGIIGAAGILGLSLGKGPRRNLLLLATGISFAAILLLALSVPPQRAVEIRYVVFCIPTLIVCSMAGYVFAANRWIQAGAVRLASGVCACALVCGVWIREANATTLRPVPDWWAATELIETKGTPGDGILTGGYLSGEATVYHMKHPERFSFFHYVTKPDQFRKYCEDPSVIWFINAAPLPEPFAGTKKSSFPYSRVFEGNAGMGIIEVACKHSL